MNFSFDRMDHKIGDLFEGKYLISFETSSSEKYQKFILLLNKDLFKVKILMQYYITLKFKTMKQVTFLLCILLSCIANQAISQIVNIEDKRKLKADTIAWLGQVGMQYNFIQNGDAVSQIKINARFDRVYNRHLIFSISNYNLVNVAGEKFINDGFQHLRYNYRLKERWTYEVFAQAQYNERLQLKLRALLGTGVRFLLIKKNNYQAFLGGSFMYEYNEETEPSVFHRDNRISSYLSFEFHPTAYLTIASTSYYQPLLNDFKDMRVSSKTSLNFNITKKLFFTTSFNFSHDTRVPVSVRNTIFSLTNGIRWGF